MYLAWNNTRLLSFTTTNFKGYLLIHDVCDVFLSVKLLSVVLLRHPPPHPLPYRGLFNLIRVGNWYNREQSGKIPTYGYCGCHDNQNQKQACKIIDIKRNVWWGRVAVVQLVTWYLQTGSGCILSYPQFKPNFVRRGVSCEMKWRENH